jgi:hypothetical protein
MKRFRRLLLTALLSTLLIVPAYAAPGTIVITQEYDVDQRNYGYTTIVFTCTANTTTGVFPYDTQASTTFDISGYVALAKVIEGTPAPTTGYDITILDDDGIDIMGGELTVAGDPPEQALPQLQEDILGGRWVNGKLHIRFANNLVNGAVVTVKLTVVR